MAISGASGNACVIERSNQSALTPDEIPAIYFRMKPPTLFFLLMFAFGAVFLPSPLFAERPNPVTLTDGWRFIRQDVPGAEAANFNDASWEKVTLPHTWNAKDGETAGSYYRGVGWYRLALNVPKEDAGKRLFIRFQAASTVADVFVNGQKVGEHLGGFSAFCFEITKFVKPGQPNELAVKVDNAKRDDLAPISGDFTIFGGLYRPVSLLIKNPICISPLDHASPGVKILTNVTDQLAKIDVTTKIDFSNSGPVRNLDVTTTIYDANGKMVVSDTSADIFAHRKGPAALGGAPMRGVHQSLQIANPHLWNGVNDPYLYKVVVTISENGKELDSVTQPLGLRYFRVDPKRGFFLNGKPYPLHGVSMHQDRLDKGWAISDADLRQDISLVREMGANAIRAAHYPHADYFYTLCDQAGILVWAEIPQVNDIQNNPQFIGNSRNMLLDLIRQEINHPSIFCWSLSNEIGNGHTENAEPDLTDLNNLAHKEDPTRLTTQAANMNNWWHVPGMPDINKIPDIIGWNSYPGWYFGKASDMGKILDQHQNIGKQHGIAVSEYGAGASIYQHEENPPHPKTTGRWHPEEYQVLVHEEDWKAIRSRPWIWGAFVWNMFDFGVAGRHEGDTLGHNDKGLVTYDRKTKKDAFFFYKAQWSKQPFVYITSRRFTVRNTATVPVKIYSNDRQIELSVNGVSQGVHSGDDEHIFRWENVPLKQGKNVIKAKGYYLNMAGMAASDQCEWTYDPAATPMQGPFQPEPKTSNPTTPHL